LSAETASQPFPVFLATLVGYALALGLLLFGLVGAASWDEVGNSFGIGLLVLGAVIGLATLGVSRGSRIGRDVLALLAAIAVGVGVVYAFAGPTSAIVPSLVSSAVAAGTIALLFVPESAKRYFAR
jgi:hypothetical protein